MPQVPISPLRTVAPSQTLEYSRAQASPDSFGAQVGAAESQLGRQIEHGADRLFVAAMDFQKRQDDADVDNVYARKFAPEFRKLYHQYYTLQGRDAVDQMPVFQAAMEKLHQDTVDSLPNDRQKHLFSSQSRKQVQIELDGMARHAAQQQGVYEETTFKSALDNVRAMAADKHNDPAAFKAFMDDSDLLVEKYGALHGKSSEWKRDKMRESGSAMVIDRISRMVTGTPKDILSAKAWWSDPKTQEMVLPQYRGRITHEINAAVRPVEISSVVNSSIPKNLVNGITDAISINGETAQGIDAALGHSYRVASAIYGQESTSGTADTSFVSAQGVTGPMQIKDTTWKQYQNMGVIPKDLKWGNPKDNKKGGDLLIAYYYNKYGGDPAKVAAAYYSGEGAVNADGTINRHFRNLQRPNDPTVGQYVDQVLSRMSGPDVSRQSNSYRDIRASYSEAMANVDRQSELLHPGDAHFRDSARAEMERNINVIARGQQGSENQTMEKAIGILSGRGGIEPPTTWESFKALGGADLIPKLSERGWVTVNSLLEQNARKAEDKPVKKSSEITQRLYSGIVDKTITDASQIYAELANGLMPNNADYLIKKLEESFNPGGLKYGPMVANAGHVATRMLMGDIVLSIADKDKIPGAVLSFMNALESRIAQEEAKGSGGDPRSLVDPKSPNNMLKPTVVKTFIQRDNIDDAAAKILATRNATQPTPIQPIATKIKNDSEYNALPSGAVFVGPDGIRRKKP